MNSALDDVIRFAEKYDDDTNDSDDAAAELTELRDELNIKANLIKANLIVMQDAATALDEATKVIEALSTDCEHLARRDCPEGLNSIRAAATWLEKYNASASA